MCRTWHVKKKAFDKPFAPLAIFFAIVAQGPGEGWRILVGTLEILRQVVLIPQLEYALI